MSASEATSSDPAAALTAAPDFAGVFDAMSDGVYLLDRQWRITYLNPAAAGLAPADALGRSIWEIWPRLSDTAVHAALRKAMEERVQVEVEYDLVLPPGTIYAVTIFPVSAGLGVIYRDVTEHHQLQRRERSRAELAFIASGLGHLTWDLRSGIVTCSARAAEIMGSPTRFEAEDGMINVHSEDADCLRRATELALSEGKAFEVENRLRRPDGSEIWVMTWGRAEYDNCGNPIGIIGLVADITEIKAHEAKLRESEARFRAFAGEAPAPLWVTRADGTIDFMNQAAIEFSGLTPDAFSDAFAFLARVDPQHLEQRTDFRPGRGDHPPVDIELRCRNACDEWRWLRVITHARHDQDGRFLGDIGLFVDVTDVHEAQARQRLLIAELNHRVKNTLATVQSLASLTLREGVDAGQARQTLVDRLLALSAAHDVLTRENWEGADLAEIAAQAARPYEIGRESRIQIQGPHARLAPNIAVGVAIGLHELATNAARHGALSTAQGRVSLSWRHVANGAALRLIWREHGAAHVIAPAHKGFGTRFLTRSLDAQLDFHPDGLICTLHIPTTRGQPDPISPAVPRSE